jgi:hypothetical protein
MISESGYFMKRSDSLLFVIIHEPCVHFIDIRPHGEDLVFAQKELLQIVHEEWPHILEHFRMRASGLRVTFDSPEDIHEQRKVGLTTIHAFGSHVYRPTGGGLTTAGTSLKVGLEADSLYIAAKRAMGYIQQNGATIRRRIASRVGLPPIVMDFHLELTEQGFLVTERNSHYTFSLFPPQD